MHNPWLSIYFIALPRKAKGLHHHSLIPSFLPDWEICRSSWGSSCLHPALQDTQSRDDRYINPWKLPVPGVTAPSIALSPSAALLHRPPTARALLREQLGSPTTTGHFLKEIFCALSLKMSNAHEQWKFISDWKTDLQRDLDHHHMKELFFLTDWELFINSELKQWSFKSSHRKVPVSGFSQYLFSEVIATTESKKWHISVGFTSFL